MVSESLCSWYCSMKEITTHLIPPFLYVTVLSSFLPYPFQVSKLEFGRRQIFDRSIGIDMLVSCIGKLRISLDSFISLSYVEHISWYMFHTSSLTLEIFLSSLPRFFPEPQVIGYAVAVSIRTGYHTTHYSLCFDKLQSSEMIIVCCKKKGNNFGKE